jgi:DNA invertase Pin-like site-specific DNA recombinase
MASKFVSYLRVSTARQGQSGLGLEAQRQAVAEHVNGHGALIGEYVEVESGKRSDNRPQLQAALAHAKATGAILIVAKLDRLARNVAFISTLMESGADFVAADMPMANKLTVHVLAAVAEHEREAISARTKAALQAAKVRGVQLGNGGKSVDALRRAGVGKRGWTLGADGMKAKADQHAAKVLPIVDALRTEGVTGLKAIARELTARGVLTARGGQWDASRVRELLERRGDNGN